MNGLLLYSTTEFLGDYGLHSLRKADPAYDENDVDNGGPGVHVFPAADYGTPVQERARGGS